MRANRRTSRCPTRVFLPAPAFSRFIVVMCGGDVAFFSCHEVGWGVLRLVRRVNWLVATKHYSVPQRITKYYTVLQNTTPHYKGLLRTTKYYKALLRLIVATHETSIAMREATGVTLQHHQVLRLPFYCTLLYYSLLYSTVLWSTLLFPTILCSSLRFSPLLYCSLLFSTLLHCSPLFSTLLFSTLLFSTVLYCTVL